MDGFLLETTFKKRFQRITRIQRDENTSNNKSFQHSFAEKVSHKVSHIYRNSLILSTNCGPGGARTLVQTGKSYAFYTLITDLIFERWQDQCHQPTPYPLKVSSEHRGLPRLSPIYLHHLIKTLRSKSSWVMSRSNTLCRNKANLLYFD